MSRLVLALFFVVMSASSALAVELGGTAFCGNGPMNGATVEAILDASQTSAGLSTTGNDGRYALTLAAGLYDIVVTPPAGSGCAAETIQNKNVTADETFDIILFRQGPSTFTVTGRITTHAGAPIAGANVRFEGPVNRNATTNAEGRYSVELEAGSYQRRVYKDEFGGGTSMWTECELGTVELGAAATLDATIPFASISGSVVGSPSGAPASGLSINASSNLQLGEGRYCYSATNGSTNAAGLFGPLSVLGDSMVQLQTGAIAGRYLSSSQTVNVATGATQTVNLTVTEVTTVAVTGVLTGYQGQPVRSKRVEFRGNQNFSANTDNEGRYTIQVVPGTYDVMFYADDFQGTVLPQFVECYWYEVEVEGPMTFDLEVKVGTAGGTVTGQPSGNPAANIGVNLTSYYELEAGQPSYCYGNGNLQTNASGAFGPTLVLAGDALGWVRASSSAVAGRYESATVSGTVSVGANVNLELTPNELVTFGFSGTVLARWNGETWPLNNAQFRLQGSQNFNGSTNGEGVASLQVSPGTYDVRVYRDAFNGAGPLPNYLECEERELAVAGAMSYLFEIPMVRVVGRVTNSAGIPISGVRIRSNTYKDFGDERYCYAMHDATSDADGRYSFLSFASSTSFSFTPPSGSGYVPANINTTLTGDLQQQVVLQLPDIVPPTITTGPLVIHHSDTSVSVQWTTNEVTDARLELSPGTTLENPTVITRSQLRVGHIVTLESLSRTTTYAYRVISKDAAGNTVTSPVQTFTTLADPDLDAPLIVSGPLVTYLAPTIVRVSWTTNEPATSEVAYGVSGGPATANAGTTTTFALNHDVVLTGLMPETSYSLVVSSRDPDDNGPSSAPPLVVTTPALPDTTPPVISALRTECVTHQAMAVCWDTDEAATAAVTFQNLGTGAVSSLTSQTLSLDRCMAVSGLSPSTTYRIAVSSADGGFNVGNAGPIERTTLPDATSGAPVISNLSATYLSETSALVTWQTDVAATTFVRFGEVAGTPDRSAGDLTAATTEHRVVLTGLAVGAPIYVTAQSTNPCQQMGVSGPLMVVDVDECDTAGVCGENATCDNTVGGYTCGCIAGFERLGEVCVDLDECDTAGICGENSTCDNTAGGYSCGCVPGFERVGEVCVDIDECDTPGICGANATCDNTAGGFTCGCVAGFFRVADTCVDIDECDSIGICGANSTCDNTAGGYECGCLPAYEPGVGGCVLSDPCHFGGPGCNFDTVILAGPANPTAERVATFSFGVVDGTPDSYECRLDGGAWVVCASPYVTPALADGEHTLLVRSLRRGVYDETPAFYGWTLDTTRPTTTLVVAPPALSGSATAAFAFAANQPVTWRCALDPVALPPSEAEWFVCGPTYTTPALSDGEHRLVVRATNTLGLDEVPDLVHGWTIDTTIPTTALEDGPDPTLCETTATFAFGSDSGVAFQCRLDDEAFVSCTSPHVREGLGEGLHVFEVFAVDVLDRPDPSPARHPFVVDTTRPVVELVTTPDLVAQSDTATLVFGSELGATFECQVGDGPFASCTSPWVLDELEDGDQRVAIRALDTCGAGPAIEFGWRVDTRWPDTAFTATPPSVLGRDEVASVSFEDPSGAASHFECSVDGADFAPCESPLELEALAVGSHTVAVRGCFDAGAGLEVSAVRCDPVPAEYGFEVSTSSCPRDSLAPELSCGVGLTVECVGGTGTVSASELEALAPIIVESCEPSLTSDSPSSFPLGTTPIVHSVVDGNGNAASCVTPVHVVDTTAPTLGCPEDLAQSAPADRCGVALSVGAATVEDACDGSPTISSDTPAEFEVGETTVTFTARDAAGLTASCTTTVTVRDETAPTISCPTVSTTTTGAFTVAPIVADACGVTATLSELSCALVSGGAASACPVSIAGDRLSVGSERPSLSLTVSVRVDAVDPSGNTTTERCSFVLPAAPAIGPEVDAGDSGLMAGGGAGCAAGFTPWHLLVSLLGIGAMMRRARGASRRETDMARRPRDES